MVRSVYVPDAGERLERLAAMLKRQPFEPSTEEVVKDKWEELIDGIENPPLLQYNRNLDLMVIWPRRWSDLQ